MPAAYDKSKGGQWHFVVLLPFFQQNSVNMPIHMIYSDKRKPRGIAKGLAVSNANKQ